MSSINGYDAITVKGQPRFRLNRKMVAAANVPADIKAALMLEMSQPKEIQPSPADIQRTAENIPTEAGVAPIDDSPLEGDDFAEANFIDEPAAPAPEPVGKSLQSLESLAREIYARFGVYTVFANVAPQIGDIHPFTGKSMNQYQTGLAYQAYRQIEMNGQRDFASDYAQVQAGRAAEEAHAQEIQRRIAEPDFDQPKWQSFAERTSVAGQNRQSSTRRVERVNDPISEDITAEPENGVRGTTIRPEW